MTELSSRPTGSRSPRVLIAGTHSSVGKTTVTLGLPADAALAIPERHLGPVHAAEGGVDDSILVRRADVVERRFDLDAWRSRPARTGAAGSHW